MNFTPKSENELNINSWLIEPGVYDFEVVDAADKLSKAGNEMIEVKIKVWDKKGREHIVYDYLLEAFAFKLKHFSDSIGLSDKYNKGELIAIDCLGKCGKANIINQTGNGYPDKNAVKDYVFSNGNIKNASPTLKKENEFINDDLPF